MNSNAASFEIDEISIYAARKWLQTQGDDSSSDIFKETASLLLEAFEESYGGM